ncbi:hypothetical protein N9U84_01985 [Candidatus Pelagibacter sp.]|nr:hypothetical protein [Candidatus Pelagibacter sp.]
MNKKFLIISSIYLYLNIFSSALFADTNNTIKVDPDKVIEGTTKIISGAISKVEIALKGKKLNSYFKNNTLNLNFNGKNKEYRFKDKTYEVFINNKLEEKGKWKVHGLIKGHIKLSPDDGSKVYYFKKISKKEIIYLYDKVPGSQDVDKTLVNIDPLEKKEEPKKVVKKEEPKKVVKKEEPKKVVKKEEPKKVVKKEEPKKEKPKKVVKKKGKNNLKTKEDLENFLLQSIIKTSAIYDGKKYISDYQFKKNGKAVIAMQGQSIAMRWEAIDGNTIRMAQDNKDAFNLFGWSEMKINYDKLVIVNTQEKDPYNQGKVSEMKILSPTIFAKKEVKKSVAKKIPEGQTVQILSLNCYGSNNEKSKVEQGEVIQIGSTFEINFEKNILYVTTSQAYGGTGKKRKHKDKILKYDNEKLVALGSPYLSDEDIGEYKIEYTFFYNPQGYNSMNFNLFGNVNNKKFEMPYSCYREYYFADNQDDGTIQTYSNPLDVPKPYDLKLSDAAFAKSFAEQQERTRKETEAAMKKFEEQISKETKNILKSVSLKPNKYGSTQLEQSQKITQAVKKEDFKKYNVDSLISYYFFESLTYYLSSLELLYKAYDNNTEAEKLNSQIEYLKSSKASEKERLQTTRQIVDEASNKIQSQVSDDSIVLTGKAKEYYQESLPYAFNATDSGYKLFVVSKGLVTEVKGSTNLLGSLLKNANELKGAITVTPLVPDYIKNIGKTAKLIFTGAKAKKIKDDKNLGDALDELDLSA